MTTHHPKRSNTFQRTMPTYNTKLCGKVLFAVFAVAAMSSLFSTNKQVEIRTVVAQAPASPMLCRQPGHCGMADMQHAYEGHLIAAQTCYTFSERELDHPALVRLNYTRLDEAEFPRLMEAYERLEEVMLECAATIPVQHIERIYEKVHHPLPKIKLPKSLGMYDRVISHEGRRFVHTMWKSTCVSPWRNYVQSWHAVDPKQQVVWWTDTSIWEFVRTQLTHTKVNMVFRRIELMMQHEHSYAMAGVFMTDLFRAVIMLLMGGVYADVDIKTTKPWEHIFDTYDVLGVFEDSGNTSGQWRSEAWRPGMRTMYGGSFIHFASRPNLDYWEHHVNGVMDYLLQKSNSEFIMCHPVRCSGPLQTARMYHSFIDTFPAEVTDKVAYMEEDPFVEYTGMVHGGHCSWCQEHAQKQEPATYFDVRAAVAPPGLMFPPATFTGGGCNYEHGMMAEFNPDGERGKDTARLYMSEDVRSRPGY